MQVDIFTQILVPVIGGLGIFMLGLEFMSNGIQALAVNKMRAILGKFAGSPIKGVLAGTFITGVIQSSTAMTVMTVGMVNAGVVGLRPAISVIMGANIGTTLGNGLIALPLGPLGLLFGGIFALVYIFAKSDKWKNIALSAMGFALIFYGLNLMTGGLRPLRGMPEVMESISALRADSYVGLLICVATAAFITALIHSSSATIGIVMGLGAAGVLDWQTAVAFSLGADLGTTITSWMASWNLSKNAKRAAYAHISFNLIGVCITIPLFFLSMDVLKWAMGWFGGDPGVPVMVNGRETFPLVPVAVGLYSTFFNIFNTALLFPFVGVFERVLSRIGRTDAEDVEDYTLPKFLNPDARGDLVKTIPVVRQEMMRHREATALFIEIARRNPKAPPDAEDHNTAIKILSREIREYTSLLFAGTLPLGKADLVASIIEEEDFSDSLGDTLYQLARRIRRENFSPAATAIVNEMLDELARAMKVVTTFQDKVAPGETRARERIQGLLALRDRTLNDTAITPHDRGAILSLLGTAERAFLLIERIDEERRSVSRVVAPAAEPVREAPGGALAAAPAE